MSVFVQALLHFGAALGVGAIIGMERSFHGRAAGFRTHMLVCLASSALISFPAYLQSQGGGAADPTRLAQGIMTGIGFLGAGVIFREGLTVRGLTTSASIWITAAIGILIGLGIWIPAALAATATFAVLTVFKKIEAAVPAHHFAEFKVRFLRAATLAESEMLALLSADGLETSGLSYRLLEDGSLFEYSGTVSGTSVEHFSRLAERLKGSPSVREFTVEPY